MVALLRLGVFGLVILTVIYWIMRLYLRSLRREDLENDWDREHPQDRVGRDAFVEQGMADYAKSLRVKLVWLVYIIPVTVVGVLIYLVNYA
ncbi:hypothetical protein [Albirhodobacter sp. R86504]|jgi:hypothetical protein|uniref:hypothetical protein n=1 Tax=Albirhodobacter sp. R86504 TaxID=3093848 RepID=UPI00366C99C6